MVKSTAPNRRRFLELAGASAGLSLAGCTGRLDGDSSASVEQSGNESSADGESRRATLVVQPDQEAMRAAQEEIRQEMESGEIDQQEAQQRMVEREQELVGEAVETATARGEEQGVTVEDSLERQGALLVEGPAVGLIDLLSEDSVGGLVDAATFEQAKEQQQQQG